MSIKSSILIVDDEKMLLDALVFEFEMEDYIVHSADSHDAAIKVLQDESIDLVISDVRMPKKSGIDLLDSIRQHNRLLPMIFITGFSDVTKDIAYSKGIDLILEKPFDPVDLCAVVDSLLSFKPENWSVEIPKVDSEPLAIEVDGIHFGDFFHEKMVLVGRRGAFIPWKVEQPIGQFLHLSITSRDGSGMEVAGSVRWSRQKSTHDFPGFGIAFETVLKPGIKDFWEKIVEANPLSTIPLGRKI